MTTFNTGNPLGSTDVYDRYDNSENLDNFSNGPLDAYPDRFGVSRQSLQGIRNASQYVNLGPYAAGLNFTALNQVFSYDAGSGAEFYAPGPSITLPYTTTGAGAGERALFRSVGDAILRADLADTIDPARGAGLVGFQQVGTGAVARTMLDKAREVVSVKDFGAVGDGVTDDTAAFSAAASASTQVIVPAGAYRLTSAPTYSGSVCWVVHRGVSFSGSGSLSYSNTSKIVSFGGFDSIESDPAYHEGIFQYLEHNSALSAYGNLGLHGSVKTNWRPGTGGGGADIAVSGFATNNLAGHLGGVWALYGTAVREAGADNAHACELDIANMGNTVPLFPGNPFAAGQTHALWLGSGGEITETASNPGTASVAIGILSNDPQFIANFDKGILFHSKAINGTDGATGSGTAVAFATGHKLDWFNNSNQLAGTFSCTNRSGTNAQRVDLGQYGLTVDNIADGTAQFHVQNTPLAANRVTVKAATAGNPPEVIASGTDASIDLRLMAKGSGAIWLGAWVGNADAAVNGYITVKDSSGNVRKIATIA